MIISENVLAVWRQMKSQYDADAHWTADYAKIRDKRQSIQPQIAQLLGAFLNDKVGIEELRSTWDVKTRTVWNSFGLKGMSSAMFLNILVRHLPDQKQATDELKRIVRVPTDEADARSRMVAFEAFLEGEIKAGHVARRFLQTARIPFFVSAFWHMQNTELWPMFYVSARKVFRQHNLYKPEKTVVEDYFNFRDVYVSLMAALSSSSWDIEQLCLFDVERNESVYPPSVVSPDPIKDETDENMPDIGVIDTSAHTQAQWLLASVGKTFNYRIWIAANDYNKRWKGQRLGDMSMATLPSLGTGNEAAEKIVRLIDVLWMKGANQVIAAFEIEHSTSIYSGLLRMADLTVLSPNISFPLYIVAPEKRVDKVRQQLSRPSLQQLELHNPNYS
jgi:hypothetical protein